MYVLDLRYSPGLLPPFDLGGYVYKIQHRIRPEKIRICHF